VIYWKIKISEQREAKTEKSYKKIDQKLHNSERKI